MEQPLSREEQVKRIIQTKKFYATLPHKIDESVEEYLTAIEDAQEAEWEFWEKLDGETPLGGPMSTSYKIYDTHERDKD